MSAGVVGRVAVMIVQSFKGGDRVYFKEFFLPILIYVVIAVCVLVPIDKDTEKIVNHSLTQSFIVCAWRVVYEVGIGKLVVSEDGKFLQYTCTKPTYKRRWYR